MTQMIMVNCASHGKLSDVLPIYSQNGDFPLSYHPDGKGGKAGRKTDREQGGQGDELSRGR